MTESITSYVKEKRIECDLTQQYLADNIGVSRQTIVAIEGGNYTPSVLLALKLADFLESSVEDLFVINKK